MFLVASKHLYLQSNQAAAFFFGRFLALLSGCTLYYNSLDIVCMSFIVSLYIFFQHVSVIRNNIT